MKHPVGCHGGVKGESLLQPTKAIVLNAPFGIAGAHLSFFAQSLRCACVRQNSFKSVMMRPPQYT